MVDAVGAHLVATGAAMAPLPSSTLPVLAFDRHAEGEGEVAGLLDFPVPGGGFAVTPPS